MVTGFFIEDFFGFLSNLMVDVNFGSLLSSSMVEVNIGGLLSSFTVEVNLAGSSSSKMLVDANITGPLQIESLTAPT